MLKTPAFVLFSKKKEWIASNKHFWLRTLSFWLTWQWNRRSFFDLALAQNLFFVIFRKSWFILTPLDSVCALACSTSDALDSLHHEALRFITARKHLHTHSSLNSILATPTRTSPPAQRQQQQKKHWFIHKQWAY